MLYSLSSRTNMLPCRRHLATFNYLSRHSNMRREPARSDNEQSSRTSVWPWRTTTVTISALPTIPTHSGRANSFRRPDDPVQHQSLLLQSRLSPHELAYQESLIQERENDIREIESGIHELAEIYRDLGTIVGEQGEMLGVFVCNVWDNGADCVAQITSRRTYHQ